MYYLKLMHEAGLFQLLSAFIAGIALIFVYMTLENNRVNSLNSRKADIFFKLRDYYLDYHKDVALNYDLDVFELSEKEVAKSGIDKKELIILYKIPLLVQREMEFCRKFDHASNVDAWAPWIVNWFKRDNFKIMWVLIEKNFSTDPEFLIFMDNCLKRAIFEQQKEILLNEIRE